MFQKKNKGIPAITFAVGLALLVPQSGKAQQPEIVTVQSLTTGDRACYVEVLDADGTYSTQYADFEICNQDLIGRDVQLTYETGEILAASCGGNPDCGETETVPLIIQAEIIEAPAMGTVQSLTIGDTACAIGFTDSQGELWYRRALFDVCDQIAVGDTLQFTYEVDEILAASCMGEPTCTETDQVTLITQAEAVTLPTSNPVSDLVQTTVGVLPDGNYRYWSAMPDGAIVSDEELLAEGGATFTFRKAGNDITGVLAYVDGEAICVEGRVNGNTVSGFAVQTLDGATVISEGETFEPFGPGGYLQVRRGFEIPDGVQYNSALLNLNGLNRINAGTRVPPRDC